MTPQSVEDLAAQVASYVLSDRGMLNQNPRRVWSSDGGRRMHGWMA